MPHGHKERLQRARLFLEQRGLCHWCKGQVLLVVGDGVEDLLGRHKAVPRNLATLDHLDSRLSPDRGQRTGEGFRKVLACWQCNWERGKAEEANLPPGELQRRSRQHRSSA